MEEQYYLYTVTGLREPFYAAVDQTSGRAWTAPTKDGAIRQAREAGIEGFIEQTITREKFLRSLGIESGPRPRAASNTIPHPNPTPPSPSPASATSWFVVDENAVDDDSNGKRVSIPRLSTSRRAKPRGGGSPFAARPIGAPSDDNASGTPDDVIIIPSDHTGPAAPTPFTDVPPPVPEEGE
ncbi:MAG TPA: hypothetical protein VFE47_02875 [Tepidisphaeraceae bacterium]|jgi:hypothetical protein|nr:hypothetical protein [Tepidisphaeraceae bacterium]